MRRKNLWLRVSSCTMAALLATTSVAPVSAADFTSEIVMEDQQDEAADVEAAVIEEDAQADASAEVAADTAEADFADTEEAFTDTYEAEEFTDSAEAVSDSTDETTQTGFGTANTELAKGIYSVPASLKNATDTEKDSMAASCIAGTATLKVAEDGTARVTVPLQNVTVGQTTSASKDWKIYKGDTTTETIDAEYTTDEEGNVNSITFTIPDKTTDGVYVNITIAAMNRAQDAFLKLDYAKAEAVAVAVDTTELEASIAKAEALEENSYTKATWDENKDAIAEALTAAKAALEAKESQETVDAANTALADAMGKLVEAGDPTELKAKIEEAKALKETDYSVESVSNYWNSVQSAITNAETAIENRETTAKLNSCKSSINTYMGYLIKSWDTTELKAKMAEAQDLKEEDYTAESWKEADIASVLTEAQDLIDVRGGKQDIEGALNNLENAMDKLVAVSVQVTVGRGDFVKKLSAGTYSLPIELLNAGHIASTNEYTSADYMKHTSMAAGCFKGNATLVIHEDGTATLTTAVGAVSSDKLGATRSDGADDWTIYENTQDFLSGKANSKTGARYKARVDKKTMINGSRKPSQISFTVPDLKQNVVATRMHIEIMGVYQDACIGLDWKNVTKVSDDTTATSTVEKEYDVKPDTMTQLINMKAGTTVKLDEDVTLTEALVIKGGTLDLNGHVLDQGDNLIRIKGDVMIIDSSAEKAGKITGVPCKEGTNRSDSTISVEKGFLTADGIAITGQIGNKIRYNGGLYLTGLPHVTVTLTNCTLTGAKNTLYAVEFGSMQSGIDVKVDNCKSEKGVDVSQCNNENVTVTNSTITSYKQTMGENGTTVFTGNKVSGSVVIAADEMIVKDDEIQGGLTFSGNGDVVVEDVTASATSSRGAALTSSGSGKVTIKSGVYTATGKNAYAINANGYAVTIEGGYFKGTKGTVNSQAYTIPTGKTLGDVTEGDYAGYQTVVDATDTDVTDPAMTIYNADGSIAAKISDEKAGSATSFAAEGQTVKLNKDIEAASETYYKNITLDLNGHTLTLAQGMMAYLGTCRVIDSSADKSGKLIANTWGFTSQTNNATGLILDGVTFETPCIQYVSIGKLYVINGTKVIGTNVIKPAAGAGATYIQDSTWTFADGTDGQVLLEDMVRTAQYSITKNEDGSFTITSSDLGKAMRAFEALGASQYTKASYVAAKAAYDEIDGTVDEDITEAQIKAFTDAVAALQKVATASDVKTLKDAVAAAKKLSSSAYTSASYKILTTAIAAAEKALAAEEPSAADIATATKALADAKAKLVKLSSQSITGVSSTYNKKFGDKAFTLKAKAKTTVSYKSSNTKVATVDKNGKVTIKGVGTAKITITAAAKNNYKAATKTVTIKVAKAAPTIKVKTTSANVRYANLRSRAQVFSLGASVNSKGKLTYKKVSGSSAISVASNGRVTVKKGMKKGTYKAVIRVYAGAKGNYNSGYKTVTVTVRVR